MRDDAVRVLITDFDGTLYRGDAPIRHYAERAAAGLPRPRRRALLAAVERYLASGAVASAEAAGDPLEAEALREAVDGWEAVAQLASRCHGVSRPVLRAAFLGTRAHMTEPSCALEVPAAYAEALTALRADGVRVVLATNSPPDGLDRLLDRLEVRPLLDAVVSGTGKPDGLRRLLRLESGLGEETPEVPAEASALLFTVGDHWRNDVCPGVEIGAATGYIDRFHREDGPADAVADDVEGILPALFAWAKSPPAAPGAMSGAGSAVPGVDFAPPGRSGPGSGEAAERGPGAAPAAHGPSGSAVLPAGAVSATPAAAPTRASNSPAAPVTSAALAARVVPAPTGGRGVAAAPSADPAASAVPPIDPATPADTAAEGD